MATVVISAYDVVNYPQGGGHFWVYLQYVLGLRLLGHDVYWLEAFRSKGSEEQEAAALATFQARMQQYGLGGKCILYRTRSKEPSSEAPAEYLNMTRDEAEAIFGRADLLLNFHYAISSALLPHFQRTALVDIDPGLLQFWITRGQLRVPDHDLYFTIGAGVGRCGGKIPSGGPRWIHIQPAVCLERWPSAFVPYCQAFLYQAANVLDQRPHTLLSGQWQTGRRAAYWSQLISPQRRGDVSFLHSATGLRSVRRDQRRLRASLPRRAQAGGDLFRRQTSRGKNPEPRADGREPDRKALESPRLPSWTARHAFSVLRKSSTRND